jgi:hypothetical protein
MAQAKKCDRCGAFYEVESMSAIEEATKSILMVFESPQKEFIRKIGTLLDLCSDCEKELTEWFNIGGKK